MANFKTRIAAIENQVKPDRPLSVIYQDLDDPEIYHYGDKTILESDLKNFEDDDHIWIIVIYDRQEQSLADENL